MFDQTFVDIKREAPSYALALSLFGQVLVLGVLLLIPLLYTQVLPSISLRSVLAAPAPPPVPPPPSRILMKALTRSPGARVFSLPTFAVPRSTASRLEPMATAPDMSVGETTGLDPGDGIVMSGVPSVAPAINQRTVIGPVRIGGGVSEANLVHRVQPLYPPLARTTHVEGTVEFTATISKQGTIENLRLVRGHPLLVNAAREAILQWRYRPTLLNGEPVEVITDIIVKFTLAQGG
jgi:periplasmic protein TonB